MWTLIFWWGLQVPESTPTVVSNLESALACNYIAGQLETAKRTQLATTYMRKSFTFEYICVDSKGNRE